MAGLFHVVAAVLGKVRLTPDPKQIPGGPQLQQLVNGIAGFALIALLGAAVFGAVTWAVGSANTNYNQISGGKRMILLALAGAIVVGAAAALVNFAHGLGGQVKVVTVTVTTSAAPS